MAAELVQIAIGVAMSTLLLAAGLVVARPAVGSVRDDEAGDTGILLLAGAVGWGLFCMPIAAFWLHMLTGVNVSAGLIGLTAIGMAATVVAWRGRPHTGCSRAHWWFGSDLLLATVRRRGAVMAAGLLVGVVWTLRHADAIAVESCITDAAHVGLGWTRHGFNLLRDDLSHSRLSAAGLVAAGISLWGQLGYRLLHGAVGLALACSGWSIGVRVGGSKAAGWLGLAVAALNPWALGIPLVDENTLAYGLLSVPCALVAARSQAWWSIAWLVGVAVTIRHPLVLVCPALLWLAARNGGAKAALQAIGGLLAATAIEHIHHFYAFGSVFTIETSVAFSAQPYTVFGVPFSWRGMLNWPLHDALVRTPHNPLPMLALWPITAARQLGTLVFSLAGIGAVVSLLRGPTQRRFWWLAFAPVAASLLLQEAWDFPNKMGVGIIVLPAVVVWSVTGVAVILRRWRPGLLALGASMVAVQAACAAAASWQVPADLRYFAEYQLPTHESQSWLAHAREGVTAARPWPDLGGIRRTGAWGGVPALTALRSRRERPEPAGWSAGTVPMMGEPVTVALDLRAPPWRPLSLLAPTDGPADIDLIGSPGRWVAQRTVGWEPQPVGITALLGRSVSVIEVGFVPPSAGPCRDRGADCTSAAVLDPGNRHEVWPAANVASPSAQTLKIRLPSGPVTVALVVNRHANAMRLHRYLVGREGATLLGVHDLWHN